MLRTFIIIFSSLCISLVTGCGSVASPGEVANDQKISEDELVIFSIVLKDLPPKVSTIGGSPHAALGLTFENIKELFPQMGADTFEDFAGRNSKPIVVEGDYLIRPRYPLVPSQSIGSDKERSAYSFSRVGFSRDRKQAFVYFHDACGALCSRGAFYLLVERDGNWLVLREEVVTLT